MALTIVLANDVVLPNDGIVDTPSRTAGGVAQRARSERRGQGGTEKAGPQMVTRHSPRLRVSLTCVNR